MKTLPLQRAGVTTGSFFSALGGVRETRLTSTLAYLVSRFPEEFGPLLGFRGRDALSVTIEEIAKGDRYDLLIRGSGTPLVVEGKLGPNQQIGQLTRYLRALRSRFGRRPALTVVDDGSEFRHARTAAFASLGSRVAALRFVTWADVARVCRRLRSRKRILKHDLTGAMIAHELATHLEENHMTTEARPEIYLRDVSTAESVELYFRHNIYKCQPEFFNSARYNLYFAPYFTRQTANALRKDNLVPVCEGISFVSRIKALQVVQRRDVKEFLIENGHDHAREAANIIQRAHRGREVLVLSLGEPRLMFVSPVTKSKLAKLDLPLRFTQGAMGSRTCRFDDLLAASQR